MFDNIKEKFENEPKVKRNVIITTAVLVALFATTVVVVNVVDNDKDFGSENSGIVAEAEAQNMGNYTATVPVDTKIGAEELLRMSEKQEEGVTPLSASTELDILAMDDVKVCFKDESVEKVYRLAGDVNETIVATAGTGVYEYKVTVKVVKGNEEEEIKGAKTAVTTTTTTTAKVTTTTPATTTTTKKVEEKKPVENSNNGGNTGSSEQLSGGDNSGGSSGESSGGSSDSGYVPEVPQQVVTQAPVVTTPAPVATEPPVVTEAPKPANNEPTGNFSFEGIMYKVDESAGLVYQNRSGGLWDLVVNGGDAWQKFSYVWGLEPNKKDTIVGKALDYLYFSRTYAGCDMVYVPSYWTAEDVYNNYGFEVGGNLLYGTYIDKTGDGCYIYCG